MKNLHALETFIVLFDTLLAATWVAMACVMVVNLLPLEPGAASSTPVQPSFDIAMPAPQALDASGGIVVASH